MTRAHPLLYLALLLKASLLSMSGLGNLPSVHADFTGRGWATESDFAQSLTIGQISPGPTGLWVVSFGYLTAGALGASLATLAIVAPPLLSLVIARAHARYGALPAVQGFVHGLGLAATGTFAAVLIQLLLRTGVTAFTLALLVGALALATVKRLPTVAILGAAALIGIAAR